MALSALEILNNHRLPLYLRPIFIGHLSFMDHLDSCAYGYIDGKFHKVLSESDSISNTFIRDYAQNISSEIFITDQDYKNINEKLKNQLLNVSRSLSRGDALKNSTRHVNLLSLQMSNLYQNPFDDELLLGQFQSTKNLSSLLIDKKDIHRQLYQNASKQNHHYTIKQPLLSSILLLSFLQHTQLFPKKEIEGLFLTSYFKDIGMSFIPREKFEMAKLSEVDKELFASHAQSSLDILQGRLPLNKNQLIMIQNHHFLNHIIKAKAQGYSVDESEILTGAESMLLSAIDILVAITSKRPYRDEVSMFKALEILKRVISEEYPQEFKSLVIFMRHFFGNK